MRRRPDRIDEELVCIDSFVQYLKTVVGDLSVVHREEPNDPPDFWVTVGTRRFAVEVTSVTNDQGYTGLCQSLQAAIKEQFGSSTPLVGKYALEVVRRPDIPKRRSKRWDDLVADAVATIKEFANSDPGTTRKVFQDKGGIIEVLKYSEEGSRFGLMMQPGAKWEGEIQNEIARLIGERIENKRKRIESKGVMEVCPDVILVLYDAYVYGDTDDARAAFAAVAGHDWLHSVYWASTQLRRPNVLYPGSPGRSGLFLYSKEAAWMGQQ